MGGSGPKRLAGFSDITKKGQGGLAFSFKWRRARARARTFVGIVFGIILGFGLAKPPLAQPA